MTSGIDFNDLVTHRAAWRQALEIARDHAEVRDHDVDDKAYWDHEIRTFDRTVGILDKVAVVDPSLPPERNLDVFFDIVSDKKAFLSTGGIARDAMFTMQIFTNAECVYELLSDFKGAVSGGGLMEYIRRGHVTNSIGGFGVSDARLVERISQAFSHVDEDISELLVNMISDARFHAPHIDVYSAMKKNDLEEATFGRWQEAFEESGERIDAFMVACIDGIDPECDLLLEVGIRQGFPSIGSRTAR